MRPQNPYCHESRDDKRQPQRQTADLGHDPRFLGLADLLGPLTAVPIAIKPRRIMRGRVPIWRRILLGHLKRMKLEED